MILIGLGANMPHPDYGGPLDTLSEAVRHLRKSVDVLHQSSWYRSAPVPASDQPWFVNAVLAVDTKMTHSELLTALHKTERYFGRIRRPCPAAPLYAGAGVCPRPDRRNSAGMAPSGKPFAGVGPACNAAIGATI